MMLFATSAGAIATVLILGALPILLGLYDYLIFLKYGSEATISRVLLNTTRYTPLKWSFALAFVFWLGTLVGHFFIPLEVVVEKKVFVPVPTAPTQVQENIP
jgi:hypothetical protein